jgi:DNA mismatch repair protein MutL
MLIPYDIHLTPSEDAFLYDCLPSLREIGFDIEESGMNAYKIKAVPTDLQNISLDEFFKQFLRDLSGLQKIKLESILKDKLAMMACKAAIKGGMHLTDEEVKQLITDMDGDATLKCPHGRPAVVVLTKYELEKMFKRIV